MQVYFWALVVFFVSVVAFCLTASLKAPLAADSGWMTVIATLGAASTLLAALWTAVGEARARSTASAAAAGAFVDIAGLQKSAEAARQPAVQPPPGGLAGKPAGLVQRLEASGLRRCVQLVDDAVARTRRATDQAAQQLLRMGLQEQQQQQQQLPTAGQHPPGCGSPRP